MEPVQAFAELGRINLAESSMEQVLARVSEVAKRTIPGADEVSVSLVQAGAVSTTAFTGKLALHLDESQYELGHGPCLAAAAGGETILISDMSTEDRWPDYTPTAVADGAGSSLSIGIPVQQAVTGGLNIYSTAVNAFDEDAVDLAKGFASYAVVARPMRTSTPAPPPWPPRCRTPWPPALSSSRPKASSCRSKGAVPKRPSTSSCEPPRPGTANCGRSLRRW